MSQDQLNDLQPSDIPSQDNGHSEALPQPPDPNQNIEQQIDKIVFELEQAVNGYEAHLDYSYKIDYRKDAKAAILALISKQEKQAFRNGQLDCQKAGDPTNHKFFKEAVSKQVTEARIDEVTITSDFYQKSVGMEFSNYITTERPRQLQTPPTPNGDLGGLERPSDEK